MTFTSDLTIDEVLLVEDVGFEPVDLVVGSSYYHVGYTGVYLQSCELTTLSDAMRAARYAAMKDLMSEAIAVGADGIVGVRLDVHRHGDHANFSAVGTAVKRRDGQGAAWKVNNDPFCCDLSGHEFWALARAGFRPRNLVMGNCVYHVAIQGLAAIFKQVGRNMENATFTQAFYEAREIAMDRMEREAQAAGGNGIVGVKVSEQGHGWGTHVVEFFAIGTAVQAFAIADKEVHEPPRVVLSARDGLSLNCAGKTSFRETHIGPPGSVGPIGRMSTLKHVLEPPRYGFDCVPSTRQIVSEFFHRLNIVRSRKNWLSLFGWITSCSLAVPLVVFAVRYFSWPLFALGFVYGMVCLGSHGTFYLHRYSTHRAYRFRNSAWRFFCKNLVLKIVPEEIYVISHHVHHQYAEKAGDPYNARAGWLYCFLADVNHQPIARDLTAGAYGRVSMLLNHCGIRLNTHAQYKVWGSLCHPGYTFLSYALNWAFWYGAFYLIGGHALATALFGASFVWAMGVRTFNFAGHGGGKDLQRAGVDFYHGDRSVNQAWPGIVAGEWHNNHHLYPNGARSGFLRYQLDLPWLLIRGLHAVGGISSYRDYKAEFVARRLEEAVVAP